MATKAPLEQEESGGAKKAVTVQANKQEELDPQDNYGGRSVHSVGSCQISSMEP